MADDQTETIRFLARADSHGVTTPVERIDTPGSILFLFGDTALKLKRAVTFPFLDYATVALRHAACRAELRLNRRTAPGLYREIRAIVRRPDGTLAFGGKGETRDWVVVMRRFDQASLFDRLAEAGALTPALLRTLADRIAAFHREAEPAPEHGGAVAVARLIDLIRTSMSGAIPDARAEAWHGQALAAHALIATRLDRRRAAGTVRRCHGDMHLRNICLVEGVPTLFDCIEFSDDIACIDTFYDLAFLLMDLWQRGLHDAANLVFNRYVDISGDRDGIAALPLFLSMRAAIRAHVSASAASVQDDSAARAREAAAAVDYLDCAFACLEPRPAPLIAVGGLSGTGKSTLAYALAPLLGAVPGARVVRSDVLRKRLMAVMPETRLSPQGYTRSITARVYAELVAETGAARDAGQAAIADAVFGRSEERAAISAVGGAAFTGFWLEAPIATIVPRLEQRIGDASDANVAVLERQVALGFATPEDWHRIDASGGPAATRAAAEAILKGEARWI